jgi:hypothetical protein
MNESLDQSIDRFSETANRIADELIAARKWNRELVRALLEIAELPCCDCGATLIAARVLNGGTE